MTKAISRFATAEDGATSIEYALIAVIVSISILAVLMQAATTLQGTFTLIGTKLRGLIQ